MLKLAGDRPRDANELVKYNIDMLLRARGQLRGELAEHCQCSRSWLDKIFSESRREVPLKYFDRIAAVFGIEPHQLLLPDVTALADRRSGKDRRVKGMVQSATTRADSSRQA